MDLQQLTTGLAWAMVLLSGGIAVAVIRGRRDIDWHASALFALAALLLAVAAAISATNVLLGGPQLPEWASWVIVVCRALSTVFFFAVVMDLTGRPRWVGRLLGRHE